MLNHCKNLCDKIEHKIKTHLYLIYLHKYDSLSKTNSDENDETTDLPHIKRTY